MRQRVLSVEEGHQGSDTPADPAARRPRAVGVWPTSRLLRRAGWFTPWSTSAWAQSTRQAGPELGTAGWLGMIAVIVLLVVFIVLHHTVFERGRRMPGADRER